MILLKDKYIYYSRKRRKRRTVKRIIFLLICAAIIIGTFFLTGQILKVRNNKINNREMTIRELWNQKDYDTLIEKSTELLKEDPLNSNLLTYQGLAYFYKADSRVDEMNLFFDQAIISLRKALLHPSPPYLKEIYFILGISYFNKEKYYYDLAVKYIEKAIEAGYNSPEALVRLGMSYGKLGNPEKELECLEKALDENPEDMFYLLIGKSFFKMNQFDKAEEYLVRYINRVDDSKTEQEARFRLGEIYLNRQDYIKAEEQYKAILELDNRSADAHFNLAEIYSELNDDVKARAELRETLRIDPSHYGARLRYYK